MRLGSLDWVLLLAIAGLPLAVGLAGRRRAGGDLRQFFLSGRNLPWWLSGTSMVATTFAADTPLAVTGIVAASGVAGNWLWWNAGLGTMLTVFCFARLWRRAGITTDVEFVELRYSGRPAAFLRGFRALYLGLLVNCLIIGWVNLALAKVLSVALGWDRLTAVFVGLAVTGCHAALAGLRGVVVSDFLLFSVATVGAWALAGFALASPRVGGLAGLTDRLPDEALRLTPSIGAAASDAPSLTLSLSAFVAFLGVQWWASWYPGQEPGGGGYLAQRMMSARSERHALLATLWFAIAHYCLRPWPWIVVALVILRWYWWRVNAVSEIAAVVSAAAGLLGMRLLTTVEFPQTLLYLAPWTTACWLTATWLTPPEPMPRLVAFYRRIRPAGPGWAPVAACAGAGRPERLRGRLPSWAAGCILVYATLFAAGAALFGRTGQAWTCGVIAAAAGCRLYRDLRRPEQDAGA